MVQYNSVVSELAINTHACIQKTGLFKCVWLWTKLHLLKTTPHWLLLHCITVDNSQKWNSRMKKTTQNHTLKQQSTYFLTNEKNEDTIHKDRQHRVRIWVMRRDIQRSIASTHWWRNFYKGANKHYSQQKYLILVHATKSGWKTGTRCMCAKFWRNATIQIRSIYTAIRNVSPKSFWHSNADM